MIKVKCLILQSLIVRQTAMMETAQPPTVRVCSSTDDDDEDVNDEDDDEDNDDDDDEDDAEDDDEDDDDNSDNDEEKVNEVGKDSMGFQQT